MNLVGGGACEWQACGWLSNVVCGGGQVALSELSENPEDYWNYLDH